MNEPMRKSRGIEASWLTVKEAAEFLRCSRQRVHQVIRAGGLVAVKSGSVWLVSSRSVEARINLLEQEAISNVNRW